MNQLDWHGARLRVVHSRCGSYEHAVGLVLAETKRMLLLLSETKRVWVPKVGSVVELTLPAASPCELLSVQCEAEHH
jgi:RNase P/RNase MRP subunit p29